MGGRSWWCNRQNVNIGSSNGLMPNRQPLPEPILTKMVSLGHSDLLTYWGRDKMAAILQTIFSNAFSWMKMYEFC